MWTNKSINLLHFTSIGSVETHKNLEGKNEEEEKVEDNSLSVLIAAEKAACYTWPPVIFLYRV